MSSSSSASNSDDFPFFWNLYCSSRTRVTVVWRSINICWNYSHTSWVRLPAPVWLKFQQMLTKLQNAKKHSMVMVSSKNVEIYNGFCNIIDIFNVLRKLWNHVFCRIVFDVMVLLITLYFLSCKHAFHCKLNSRTFYCIGFSKPFSSKIWKLSKKSLRSVHG